MNLRKITSVVALLCGLLMLLTSIVLFLVPQGRIAYWSDWRLWGMSKTQWSDVHTNVGFLFLISLVLHIYYNFKPLLNYLKNKARQFRLFTTSFNLALLLVTVVVAGTLLRLPPFSSLLDLGAAVKDAAAREYGEPPYGHAELSSLKTFTKKMGLDLEDSITRLNQAGFRVDSPEQTLVQLGQIHGVSPQRLYLAMKPEQVAETTTKEGPQPMPATPVTGTGSRSLADVCAEYGLHLKKVQQHLADSGIENALAEKSLKDIAADNQRSPIDIYLIIQTAQEQLRP